MSIYRGAGKKNIFKSKRIFGELECVPIKFSLEIDDVGEEVLVDNFLAEFDLVVFVELELVPSIFDEDVRLSGDEGESLVFDFFAAEAEMLRDADHVETRLDEFDEISVVGVVEFTEDALEDFFVVGVAHSVEEDGEWDGLVEDFVHFHHEDVSELLLVLEEDEEFSGARTFFRGGPDFDTPGDLVVLFFEDVDEIVGHSFLGDHDLFGTADDEVASHVLGALLVAVDDVVGGVFDF